MKRSLPHLQTRAWDELAVGVKGFTNVRVDDTTSKLTETMGIKTPKEPMKDLVHSVTQATYEEFEPTLRRVDYLPDFENPVSFVFSSSIATPVTFFHKLYRIPTGYVILEQDYPISIYATIADKLLWTPVSITLRAAFINLSLPTIATGRLVLV